MKLCVLKEKRKISMKESCKVLNVKFTTLVCNLTAFKKSRKAKFKYGVRCETRKRFYEKEELSLVRVYEKFNKDEQWIDEERSLAYKSTVAKNKNGLVKRNEGKATEEGRMRQCQGRHPSEIKEGEFADGNSFQI
ncbi:hypothetical protein AVEN_153376-1 [Araneus ventricosus]|uniref:HTH psq-type domain-containing protein n=1 Tax=Araneus ventricosus TaxID=182803 RepID=A0A4Y2FR87_ARAVE|nr:hypothetical protein AVEN_153376-1 [Araneus ventricosus]